MKKNIEIIGLPFELKGGCEVEVNDENPLTSNEPLRSGYFELIEPLNKNITWGTKSLRLAKN